MSETDLAPLVTACLDEVGPGDARLVVGVSGGRDSVVLLDASARAATERGLEVIVAHVNHSLRGREADADEAFVRQLASAQGLRFRARSVDPEARRSGQPSRSRPTLEEAARDLRREALVEIADSEGAQWILLAHHMADQAETVLLRILRGTSPAGLAGMARVDTSRRVIRPFLGTSPERIEAAARARGLDWREDPSNRDLRFARNRLRHEVIPALEEHFHANLLRNLVNLAEAERRELEWTDSLVLETAKERMALGPAGARLTIDGWDTLPEALALRLVRHVLVGLGLGRHVRRVHLERVLDFLRRGRSAGRDLRIELPEGILLRRQGDAFVFEFAGAANEMHSGGDATVPQRD